MVVVINNPIASNTPIIAFILAINFNIFPSIISNIVTLLHLVMITLFYSQFEFFVTKKTIANNQAGSPLTLKVYLALTFH